MQLSPRELNLMYEGYIVREKQETRLRAYFATMMTNVHIAKGRRITVEDVMRRLYPLTRAERIREEKRFIEEWEKESRGGED